MSSAPILVTGSTGFVGSAVTRALLAAGHRVRCLVRDQSPRRNLDGLAVDTVVGTLTDRASLERAVAGCRALFHVAADYRLWVRDSAAMTRVNVDGTRDLMQAALAAGIERVVYTSSVAALGLIGDGTPGTEDTPVGIDDMVGPYKRSKFLAEQAVRDLIVRDGLPAVIVNPSTPVGPRDIRPTPTGRIIVEAAAGRMPAFVDTGLNLVHVDDVAAGHLLAFEKGRIGERYILGGEDMTLARMLAEIAALVGRRAPTIRLPRQAIMPFAMIAEGIARVTGREPFATCDGLRMARKKMFFSSAKARRDLGYAPRPARDGLADAVAWFRGAGYLK